MLKEMVRMNRNKSESTLLHLLTRKEITILRNSSPIEGTTIVTPTTNQVFGIV